MASEGDLAIARSAASRLTRWYLGVETEQVLEGLEAIAARHAASLDEPIVSDSRDESALVHESIGSDDEGYEKVDTSATLAAAVKKLRPAGCLHCELATNSHKKRLPTGSVFRRCRSHGCCAASRTSYANGSSQSRIGHRTRLPVTSLKSTRIGSLAP